MQNSQRKKWNLQQSDMGGIAVIATTSTTNDLLHCPLMPSMQWLIAFYNFLILACMPWTQASCLHKMLPLQLAGGAAHVVFVCATNAKWNLQPIDMGGIAVITMTSTTNQAPQMTCCIIDRCRHFSSWLLVNRLCSWFCYRFHHHHHRIGCTFKARQCEKINKLLRKDWQSASWIFRPLEFWYRPNGEWG